MKKYFFSIIFSLIIGGLMAFFLINSYDNKNMVIFSKNVKTVFYIERGVYSTKENMEENMMDFENYIYNVEEGKYHAYIGLTLDEKTAFKIQKYYDKYNTKIVKKVTDNKQFLAVLGQYDEILLKTNDTKTIKTISHQVLSKYEELTSDEY